MKELPGINRPFTRAVVLPAQEWNCWRSFGDGESFGAIALGKPLAAIVHGTLLWTFMVARPSPAATPEASTKPCSLCACASGQLQVCAESSQLMPLGVPAVVRHGGRQSSASRSAAEGPSAIRQAAPLADDSSAPALSRGSAELIAVRPAPSLSCQLGSLLPGSGLSSPPRLCRC
jgi:hypothetical protein